MSSAIRAYRKLSSWQGFLCGAAALFADEHCLISVRSSGYEERVKRLSFNDIEAIVVSKSRRFGVSRKVFLGAVLLLISILFASRFAPRLTWTLWTLAGGLALIWLYLSIAASCRCRVYTAVSQEDLPSVRRPWTASKVLAQLVPRIEAAQGTLPAGWRESVSIHHPIVLNQARGKSNRQAGPADHAASSSSRSTASGLLVASLILDVVVTGFDMQRPLPMPAWIGSTIALIEVAAAVWVLIQNRNINIYLQRLAAAVLIFLGLTFYAQYAVIGFAQAQAKRTIEAEEIHSNPAHRTFVEIYIAGCLVLGIAGAVLTLAERPAGGVRV